MNNPVSVRSLTGLFIDIMFESQTQQIFLHITISDPILHHHILTPMAAYCGLSLSEYLCKVGLGFELRPALGDDFYDCYYRLCELCNRELSEDVEAELLYLIDDIRGELMLPGKRNRKEVAAWQQQASGPSRDS